MDLFLGLGFKFLKTFIILKSPQPCPEPSISDRRSEPACQLSRTNTMLSAFQPPQTRSAPYDNRNQTRRSRSRVRFHDRDAQ